MRTPPPAYYAMRSAYARWFWKLPAGVMLIVLAMVAGRFGKGAEAHKRRGVRSLPALLFAAAAAVLLDSARDRGVYETNREIYQSTPDTMPG